MILGVKHAGTPDDPVIKADGQYSDVVSFDYYQYPFNYFILYLISLYSSYIPFIYFYFLFFFFDFMSVGTSHNARSTAILQLIDRS